MARKILITCGLPYANGQAHLGHLVEYIQGDIYARVRKLSGEDAVFLCASDTHGTPIEVKAREAGKAPEEFSAFYSKSQLQDFRDFGIEFDYFYTTHSEENRKHAEKIFSALKERGEIVTRPVEQYYCETDKRFLPDRFIKGTCPVCKAPDQYGDVCEKCGKTYNPTDLIGPYCVLCGTPPVRRTSTHYFFTLGAYTERLRAWLDTEGRVQPEIRNFVSNWIQEGLRDWDISRDGPYFGFKIPGEEDKYFYVWLDAPIGYISTTEKFCKETGRNFDEYWHGDAEIEHIIGKDIVYFHTLFWPAMLMGSGYTLPSRVIVHGMLKVNGEKMSKTRGTFINARPYLDLGLDPQYLRYYYAAHMTPRPEDIDLNLKDFADRVNGELINNIVNLSSRSLQFAASRLDGKLGKIPEESRPLLREVEEEAPKIIALYRERDFAGALRKILAISAKGNLYLQEQAPWEALKTDPERARGIITTAANIVKVVVVLLKPVLPKYAADIEQTLNLGPLTFADARCNLEDAQVGPFKKLVPVDKKIVEKLIMPAAPQAAAPQEKQKKQTDGISIEDFGKIDLRVGQIQAAEAVPKADKLLKLSVDLGEGAPRTIIAGIALAYRPEELLGRKVAVVANLAKKKLRGVESHGMILAAGEPPRLLSVADDLPPGTKIQ